MGPRWQRRRGPAPGWGGWGGAFLQDQPVLESQRPQRLPLDVRAEMHTAADKASSAYRRFLKDSGITFGVC